MPHASTAPAAPHMGPGPSHTEQTAHASREDLGPEMLMSLSQAAQQESALPQQGGRLDGHMHGQMAAHEQHHMMQQRPMEQVRSHAWGRELALALAGSARDAPLDVRSEG